MDRRQFLTAGAAAAAAGAAISLPTNPAQAADSPGATPAAGASGAPAILASYTADDHRRRLTNIAVCTRKIRKCMRKHLITDYLPAQCVYNMGEYPSRKPWEPGECDEQELDLVLTATPWEWHVPVCLAALRTGKHAATEVPAAVTLDECWQMVEAAERYRKHCVMLENCCYDRREMLMLNLVRQGVFGELLHGECSYQHDLRDVKFSTDGEGLWRRAHATRRNGNLYPTHGLGPVSQCLDINRGDRFDYLVSMSSLSVSLAEYREKLRQRDRQASLWFEQKKYGEAMALYRKSHERWSRVHRTRTDGMASYYVYSGTDTGHEEKLPAIIFMGHPLSSPFKSLSLYKDWFDEPVLLVDSDHLKPVEESRVSPEEIAANREAWLNAWSETVLK